MRNPIKYLELMKIYFGASKKLDYTPRRVKKRSRGRRKNYREVLIDLLTDDRLKGMIWNRR
jgi:hypothetical protein